MKAAKLTVRIPEGVFNKAYLPLLDCRERYIVLYGGAGSGKSFFAAQRTIYKLLRQTCCNVLVVRACAATHRNSTFALLRRVIAGWKLDRYFKVYEGELRIRCLLGGNEIVFRGLDDAEKLKSITFARGDLTDIWVEEASEIKEADFHQLYLRCIRPIGTTPFCLRRTPRCSRAFGNGTPITMRFIAWGNGG